MLTLQKLVENDATANVCHNQSSKGLPSLFYTLMRLKIITSLIWSLPPFSSQTASPARNVFVEKFVESSVPSAFTSPVHR